MEHQSTAASTTIISKGNDHTDHKHSHQISPQETNLLLINSNVEEVHLEVSHLEDEAFEEYGLIVVFLDFVVLQSGRVDGHLAELNIHDRS